MLPVAQYPDITPPTVQVACSYPGANAQVVADSVAAPIEQQVNGVEHMLYMSSQCTNDGVYNLTVTFELGTDLNMAQVLVQNRVALATAQLPQQVQLQGVTVKKKSPSILLCVNLVSPDGRYDDLYLSNYATIQIKDELLRIDGVGDIAYLGQRDYSLRVWLDPDKMAAMNLSTADVIRAIQNQNVQAAVGQIGQAADEAGPIVPVDDEHARPTRRRRAVSEHHPEDRRAEPGRGARLDGRRPPARRRPHRTRGAAIRPDVPSRRPAFGRAGGVSVAGLERAGSRRRGHGEDEGAETELPAGLDYKIVYDTTPFVKQSISEVFKTLFEAVILVAIVVLFFLQDWKAMILPMIDVPVSLVGTFAVMALLGFSLNNLTLFGLVLAIGIVVDDAIVVLENIERQIATGLDPRSATIKAMGEITGPIVAITLVLISVFLPAATFVPGITGQFYRQFALTIAASMVISAVNAMTLTPARAVAIFKTEEGRRPRAARGAALVDFRRHRRRRGGDLGPAVLARSRCKSPQEGTMKWLVEAAFFLPGAIAGGCSAWSSFVRSTPF